MKDFTPADSGEYVQMDSLGRPETNLVFGPDGNVLTKHVVGRVADGAMESMTVYLGATKAPAMTVTYSHPEPRLLKVNLKQTKRKFGDLLYGNPHAFPSSSTWDDHGFVQERNQAFEKIWNVEEGMIKTHTILSYERFD